MDENAYQGIQFSRNVLEYLSSNNSFKVLRIQRGEPVVDAKLSNDSYPTVRRGFSAILQVYNKELISQPVKIWLEVESEASQNIEITGNDSAFIQVNEGRDWYEIDISNPANEYTITASDGIINLYSYTIVPNS